MRKFLALTLSVILTFSCFVGILTTSAVAAEVTEVATELISNGDFEDTSKNAVGSNMGGIRDTTDPDTLNNGKWYRATGGLSYATYGDLSAYDADTDTVTKAEATEYAKYFTACSTVIAQPDDATNHIGRAQQTLFQAINISEGTYAFKFKVRVLEATPSVVLYLRGLQSDANGKITDSFYNKYTLEVVEKSGDFTYSDEANAGIVIYPDQKEIWTDVELIVKVTEITEPVSSNTAQSVVKTDFTMLQFYHDNKPLNSATNGSNYRTTGMYLDDISVKAYTNPFGEAEFYKDGKKLENTNEYAEVNYTVNGEETIGISAGDTVTATPDYNADGNVFVGWYKGDEVITRDETLTFTVNSTDVYVPKFVNRNLLTDTAASFEGDADGDSLLVADTTTYPEVGTWGANANKGYYGLTKSGIIYDVDGYAYQQVDGGSVSQSDVTKIPVNVTVSKAYKGNNSLKLTNSYHALSTMLDVEPNKDYVLSYYLLGTGGTKEYPVLKNSGIATTLNIGSASEVTAQDDGGTKAASLKKALSDLNSAYALKSTGNITFTEEKWQKITFNFNSRSFEELYFVVAPTTSEVFYIDELTLYEVTEASTLDVKFIDTKGNAIEDASNLYAKATVMEDFDGSNLLSIDYENESGAYIFAGWYDANDTRLSLDEVYDYNGDLEGVYAKIISKNLLDSSASFESYESETSLQVTDNTKYPEMGEWGANRNAGYYGVTVEEIIYDKYGYAYLQNVTGSLETISASGVGVTIRTNRSYKGANSLYFQCNSRSISTGLDVTKDTNYTLTYYVLSNDYNVKYSGIATTLNVSNASTPVAQDGGTLASGMCTAMGNLGTAYAIAREENITATSNGWTKVTHTFNSGNFEKLYFVLCPIPGGNYYIDELSLVAEEKPETLDVKFVDAEGNDLSDTELANVSAEAVVETDIIEGTTTATINYARGGAYTFLGWYNADGECVETAESFAVTGSTDGIYAKMQSKNLLTYAASYEGYDVDTQLKYTGTDYPSGVYFGGSKNAGYLGQTYEETIYDNKGNAINQIVSGAYAENSVSAKVSDSYVHTGERSVRLANGFWTASMGLDVTPNTDYMLSYYILAPKDVNKVQNTIQLSAIATTLNTGVIDKKLENQPEANATNMAINQASTLYLDSKTLTPVHDGKNWVKVTHTFNSMNLSKVYLIIGQTSYSDTGNLSSWAYIDDMTMMETVPTTMDVEMKSCASLDLIDADMDGLYVGQQLSFKVIENIGTAATVIFNGEAVTPNAEGIYTVTLIETNELSVRFEGDEALPDYDEDEFGRKLSENNHEVYSEPVWEGDTVYHETALFTPDKDTVKLLYPVDNIVSLRSYDLKTNYIEGYDFEITDDGQIKRLEGGRIPVWSNSLVSETDTGWDRTDGKYVVLTGDTTYPEYAISVTYKHSTTFEDGYNPVKPDSQEAAINNVIKKLENGEEVNIVIYGDSISCGWSSSGLNSNIKIYDDTNTEGNYITRYNINVAPYAPTWIQMLETELKSLYPNATINFKNLALGGKSSPWGAENIAARLALWKDEDGNQVTPDLMLLGFGVNDSSANITSANFKTNMQAIIDNARVASGNYSMEVLMYSPMLPNQDAVNWPASTLLAYEEVMQEIADADINAGLVKLTSIFNEIVKCKDPEDYLNTNLNHGNDFTARVYYNAILAAMESDEALDSIVSADDTFDGVGAAIRKEGEAGKPQAIRVKYDISKAVLGKEYSGYKIVEYGAIVAKSTAYGDELDLGDVQYGKAKKGVAYSEAEGKEIIFASSDTAYTYSLALYNIGAKKDDDGNVTRIDYAEWGTEYSVRAYAIYSAEGKPDLVVYSDEVLAASVFGVMQAIEERGNELDKKYLTDDLLSKEEISTAYNEWKDQIDA